MSGYEYLDTAYSDKGVAQLIAIEMHEEWVDYTVSTFKGELINGYRIIVDNKVYNLDTRNKTEKLIEVAKKKLSKEELEALYETRLT